MNLPEGVRCFSHPVPSSLFPLAARIHSFLVLYWHLDSSKFFDTQAPSVSMEELKTCLPCLLYSLSSSLQQRTQPTLNV